MVGQVTKPGRPCIHSDLEDELGQNIWETVKSLSKLEPEGPDG